MYLYHKYILLLYSESFQTVKYFSFLLDLQIKINIYIYIYNLNMSYDYSFEEFHESMLFNLKYMSFAKKSNKSQNDFKQESLETFDENTLSSDIFLKFFDISWQNCDNEVKAKDELNKLLDELNQKQDEAVVIQNVIVAYVLLTKIAKGIQKTKIFNIT